MRWNRPVNGTLRERSMRFLNSCEPSKPSSSTASTYTKNTYTSPKIGSYSSPPPLSSATRRQRLDG